MFPPCLFSSPRRLSCTQKLTGQVFIAQLTMFGSGFNVSTLTAPYLQTSSTANVLKHGIGVNISTASVLLISYLVFIALYSLVFQPLARFPGPRSCAVSRLPFWVACITGKQVEWMHKLHTRYGPVVRYSPNDLSFADEDGTTWKAIHGHGKDEREFPKAKEWFVSPANGTSYFPCNQTPSKPWLT